MELQPQVFVEMSEELGVLKGIKNGERVKVSSSRGALECTAVVTKRFKPMKIAGTVVHQVGMPYNYRVAMAGQRQRGKCESADPVRG